MDTPSAAYAPAPGPPGFDPTTITSEWLRQEIQAVLNVVVVMMRKGGAGKTTLTLLLADALARFGLSVLVIDMDPQGNASIGLGREVQIIQQGTTRLGAKPLEAPAEPTVCDVIEANAPGIADEAIMLASEDWTYPPDDPFTQGGPLFRGRPGVVGVIPCYSALEKDAYAWAPSDLERLGTALLLPAQSGGIAPHRRWDVVLIDTPPGGSMISVQAAKAAFKALLVTQAQKFGAKALPETQRLLEDIRRSYFHPDLDVVGLVLNEYTTQERRTQRNITAQIEEAHRAGVPLYGAPLWGLIPDRTIISDAQDSEAPVSAFLAASDSRGPAGKVCQAAEEHGIRLLHAIQHPQAAEIERAWRTVLAEQPGMAAAAAQEA